MEQLGGDIKLITPCSHDPFWFPQNLVGSFRCACPEGFIQHFYYNECVDDNECAQSPCGTSSCINTYGSFRCGCPEGYQYDSAMLVCVQSRSDRLRLLSLKVPQADLIGSAYYR
uniref:EGF-like domain-containing protein n=1 Tax=Timema genevievae TaxID=629358 RepID=A0A7R9JWQ3_TIMGE|nr:unnamed protein product [Timema genevievae]